jgi:hypothetical protein
MHLLNAAGSALGVGLPLVLVVGWAHPAMTTAATVRVSKVHFVRMRFLPLVRFLRPVEPSTNNLGVTAQRGYAGVMPGEGQ